MIRRLFKLASLVLLLVVIGNYLIYLKTGQMPLRDVRERMGDDWWAGVKGLWQPEQLAADAKQAMKTVADKVSEPEPAPLVRVYKWTDANGQVHFGDKPVGRNAEQIAVNTRNAISAPEVPATPTDQPTAEPRSSVQESALDKARAAAAALQERVQQQEQLQ